MNKRYLPGLFACTWLVLASPLASAHGEHGTGMMSHSGPGMSYGAGQGMMNDYGCNTSMMNDYGPGMMMGSYGHGPGMMWYEYPDANGNLNAQQRNHLRDIQQQLIKQQTPLMQQMMAHQAQLHSLYLNDNIDPEAISEQYKQIFSLRQQMIRNNLQARQQSQTIFQQVPQQTGQP
ncbi:hypothetical protein BH688_10525 [Kushneria phosphatilytica]|nr:hypothetical protein BH688_10525 [Kushneria phosphatilytica]